MLPGPIRSSFEGLSEHVVYSSALYVDLRSRVIRMESANIDFSLPPRTEADERALRAATLLRPYATRVPLVRIGGMADGGYVMAEAFEAPYAVSLGVGPTVTWDVDIAHRGIGVRLFDPTVDALPTAVPGGVFHRVGLGTEAQRRTSGMDLVPFDAILDLAGIGDAEAILKIDIEGAEWDALADVDFARFPQVVMEMHDLNRLAEAAAAANVLAVLASLHRTHVPVHLHGNNEVETVPFGRYWMPGTLEASYLRRDLAGDARPATTLDTSLDSPSNARFADVDLTGLLTAAPAE